MIPHIIEERRSFPVAAISLVLMAVICIIVAFSTQQWDWAVFAVLPLLIGAAALIAAPAPFRMQVNSDGLILEPAGEVVLFRNISRVVFVGSRTKADRGVIQVTHDRGDFSIPERICVPAVEVYRFLKSNTQCPPAVVYDPAVHDYLHRQAEVFGAPKVFAYSARPEVELPRNRWAAYVGPAMLITTIIWLAIGTKHVVWGVMAIAMLPLAMLIWILGAWRSRKARLQGDMSGLTFALMFGALGAAVWSTGRSRRSGQLTEGSLVISPAGLALSQGDLRGQMRWAEVNKVSLKDCSWITRLVPPRIELRLLGATLDIHDLYGVPLPQIYEQIETYWKAG